MKSKAKKPTVKLVEPQRPTLNPENALHVLFMLQGEKTTAQRNLERLTRSIDETARHLLNVMVERSGLRIAEDGTSPKDELKMEREISSHVAHGKAQKAVHHETQQRLAMIDGFISTLDPHYVVRGALEEEEESAIADCEPMRAKAPVKVKAVDRSPVKPKRSKNGRR